MKQTDYRPANPHALNELVRASGLPFRENSRSFIFDCPRCGKENKLFMFKKDGRFVCWVCKEVDGFAGRPEFALVELTGIPIGQLRKTLYGIEEQKGASFLYPELKDFFGDEDEVDEDAFDLQPMQFPPDFYPIDHKFSVRGREYLEGRGVSLELAQSYGLRFCPPQRRVIIPIQWNGTVYGWQGRLVVDNTYTDPDTGDTYETPKILTPIGVKKEHTLMFWDRLTGSPHVVLCEGPFDAIKADLCGGNVATMGKAVSQTQIGILRNCGVQRIYLALDPDAALEVWRLTKEFFDLEVYWMRAPAGTDLGAMTPEAVRELFVNAVRVRSSNVFGFIEGDVETLDRRRIRWDRHFRG
jgi:hypothetical protein